MYDRCVCPTVLPILSIACIFFTGFIFSSNAFCIRSFAVQADLHKEREKSRRSKKNFEWMNHEKYAYCTHVRKILCTLNFHRITKTVCRNNRKWLVWNCLVGWLTEYLTDWRIDVQAHCLWHLHFVDLCVPFAYFIIHYIRSGIRSKSNHQRYFVAMNCCTVKLFHFNVMYMWLS